MFGLTALEKYGENLTQLAREGKITPHPEYQEITARCITILSRKRKTNPVFIDGTPEQKRAILENIAFEFLKEDAPEKVKEKNLIVLDTERLLDDTEAVIFEIFDQVSKRQLPIIFYLDNVHRLLGVCREIFTDYDIYHPFYSNFRGGYIHCIAATTLADYRKCIEPEPGLERNVFQPMVLSE